MKQRSKTRKLIRIILILISLVVAGVLICYGNNNEYDLFKWLLHDISCLWVLFVIVAQFTYK